MFPAEVRHRPSTSINFYCLVTKVHVRTTCLRLLRSFPRNNRTHCLVIASSTLYTATPLRHHSNDALFKLVLTVLAECCNCIASLIIVIMLSVVICLFVVVCDTSAL